MSLAHLAPECTTTTARRWLHRTYRTLNPSLSCSLSLSVSRSLPLATDSLSGIVCCWCSSLVEPAMARSEPIASQHVRTRPDRLDWPLRGGCGRSGRVGWCKDHLVETFASIASITNARKLLHRWRCKNWFVGELNPSMLALEIRAKKCLREKAKQNKKRKHNICKIAIKNKHTQPCH